MSVRKSRGEDDEQGSGADDQQQRHAPRRIRPALSFRSIVRRAVAAETIQQIVLNLEPVIRTVVREEIQNFFSQHGHLPYRSLPSRILEVEGSPPLKLVFVKRLMLPIYTNNKLVDIANDAIEIQLVDARTNYLITPTNTHLGSSIRLEVLVLDGDFRCEDGEGWTDDQFNMAIVKAREGKRPLLVGTLIVTMSNHGVAVIDDVSFTDNSSWIRSRKFRIGVRIMPTSYYGPRIQEAVSESFTVKDHRGELDKKHFPPLLTDNVWRLKNIRKDGPIDKRLESKGIKNVQDFLKLNTIDPDKLKNLIGMSGRQWSTTLNHAKTCDMGEKCYVFKSDECDLTFNPIGEVLAARIGDLTCPLRELHPQQMVKVKQLAIQAYQQWDRLEEVVNVMALASNKSLIPFHQEKPTSGIPANYIDQAEAMMENSGWQPSESQESRISSGSKNAKCIDYIGTAISNAAMASNNSTLDSAAAVAANDVMYWSPITSTNNHFSWQNSTNIGCWDQVD